jgi:DNA-binding LacI/PurR family transcriptional regulator
MKQRVVRSTIKEVASMAGVSPQTVSRVINERPDVSPETRKRVQEVIKELDYRPSALARGLIHQRRHTLGVVTAGLQYIGPSRTLSGIATAATWIFASGAHHTGFSYSVTAEHLRDFAEMAGIEFLLIDENTRVEKFKEKLRWNDLYYQLASAL